MKQFIVDRHTTPNTPTLEQVPTEKIPVYNSETDLDADLANLADGQIVATKDTGSELSAPVDTVQSGNMHAVTSNAVAESLSYSTTEQATGGTFPVYDSGQWVIKPIYRKVFLVADVSVPQGLLSGLNIDTLIRTDSVIWQNNSMNIQSDYFAYNTNTGNLISKNDQWVYYVIVEYTKTTD